MAYLLSALASWTTLSWLQDAPKFRPLPLHVERKLIPSPGGDLELLICAPSPSSSSTTHHSHPPLFFMHGGYGSAGVWLEWMTYLHDAGYGGTLYAFSARNHGASYTLPFWRMVWLTSFADIQADARLCLEHAHSLESSTHSLARRPPILIAHSSGGGIAQSLLSCGAIRASGLALVDAIPSFGSYDMYWNWLKHDPWFPLRNSFHLQHPTSPLSTDELVHGAFFSKPFARSAVAEFRTWMPRFEAMGWPLEMLGDADVLGWLAGGRANTWLDCADIVRGIEGVDENNAGEKICILVGRDDMMYRPPMWQRQVAEYQAAILKQRRGGHAVTPSSNSSSSSEQQREQACEKRGAHDLQPAIDKIEVATRGNGVRLLLVADSGHHVQNDIWRDRAAEALLAWIRQV